MAEVRHHVYPDEIFPKFDPVLFFFLTWVKIHVFRQEKDPDVSDVAPAASVPHGARVSISFDDS